jgi:hypothetical protein
MEGDVKVSCINVIGEDAKKNALATLSYTWLVNKNNVKEVNYEELNKE